MKTLFISFCLLVTFTTSFSQSNKIFDFDYAQFGYDSVSNYLEIYYSFNQEKLSQEVHDNNPFIEGLLKVKITDSSSNTAIIDREWKISHQLKDSLEMSRKNLVGVIGFQLPVGTYTLDITGGNNNLKVSNSFSEKLVSDPYYSKEISLSDIQLSSNILQDATDQNSMFYKNSLEVVPSATAVFGENMPVVFYYSEIYNLQQIGHEHQLKIFHIIYNSKNQVLSRKVKNLSTSLTSKVEIGSLAINKFPTDQYTVVISLVDSVGNYGVSSSKKFFVYNPGVQNTDTISGIVNQSFSTLFGAMSEEELDDIYSKSKYIATSQELSRFNTINGVEGKREFIYQFWKERDRNIATPENEALIEYLARVTASNARFGTPTKVGWKTDRGRILISYGEPSEIERFPNQMDARPYEIWHYNDLEGGVLFIFADVSGFSDYLLLHSTKRGELRDDNWQRRVFSY